MPVESKEYEAGYTQGWKDAHENFERFLKDLEKEFGLENDNR
jgi:hypothetical protein